MLVWSIAWPVVLTLIILFPLWKRLPLASTTGTARQTNLNQRMPWLVLLVFMVMYPIAHLGLQEHWAITIPPPDVKFWTVYFMLPVAALGLWTKARGWWWEARTAVWVLVYAGFFLLVLKPFVTNTWSRPTSWMWIGGLTVGASLFSVIMNTLSARLAVRVFLFPIGLWIACSAGIFFILAMAQTAFQTAAVATMLGIVFIVMIRKRMTSMPFPHLGFPIAFMFVSQWCEVYFYSYAQSPALPLFILATGPLMLIPLAIVLRRKPSMQAKPIASVVLATVAIGVPTLCAGAKAYYDNYVQSSASTGDEYDSNEWADY